MTKKLPSNRPQINVRLDKHPELLNEIKQAVNDRNTSASEFVINAIKSALGQPTTTAPNDRPSLEAILAELDELIDVKLDKRLGEFKQRLLAEFRQDDRQSAPEEDRQVTQESRPETRLDYQEIRDRVLRSFTTGRGRIAPSAPQYKSAVKALDRFISQLEADANPPVL